MSDGNRNISKKAKLGRPTKYRKDLPQSMIDYFTKNEPYWVNDEGEKVANDLPTFGMWCVSEDITQETMLQWTKDPDKQAFSEAYKKCKDIQSNFLMLNGCHGLYHGSFAIFTAKNVIGWRDQIDTKVEAKGEIALIDKQDNGL